MEEQQITVDGVTHRLPDPFLVMATQNPIEYEGTFPLPEAQLDRFMLNISLGYPAPADEVQILGSQQRSHPIDALGQILEAEDLIRMQRQVREIEVHKEVKEYIVALVAATRQHQHVYLGASPRGSLALFHASQALAALEWHVFRAARPRQTVAQARAQPPPDHRASRARARHHRQRHPG